MEDSLSTQPDHDGATSRLPAPYALAWLVAGSALLILAFGLIWQGSSYPYAGCDLSPTANRHLHWAVQALLASGGLLLVGFAFASGWRGWFALGLVFVVVGFFAGFQVSGPPHNCPGLFS